MSHKVNPLTLEELLQQFEEAKRQHSAEGQMLTTEFGTAKQELANVN